MVYDDRWSCGPSKKKGKDLVINLPDGKKLIEIISHLILPINLLKVNAIHKARRK